MMSEAWKIAVVVLLSAILAVVVLTVVDFGPSYEECIATTDWRSWDECD